MSGEEAAISAWPDAEDYQDWVNDLMVRCGDEWDGDVAMEAIVTKYVRHLEDEVRRLGGCRLPWCWWKDDEPCNHGYLDAPVFRDGSHDDGRCRGTLGTRPGWMSPDQYDPCRCYLDRGHAGPHWCDHLDTPDPRESGSKGGGAT